MQFEFPLFFFRKNFTSNFQLSWHAQGVIRCAIPTPDNERASGSAAFKTN
jgi:hypothetical protein